MVKGKSFNKKKRGLKMIEYNFNEVDRFWSEVYRLCDERKIKIEYVGREGNIGCGDYGKFVKVVEEVVLEFCKEKY